MKKELQARLKELNISPKKSLGQNFLINEMVIDKIISSVEDIKPKHLVEIGPGLGALTEKLISISPSLSLVEFDSTVASFWKQKSYKVFEEDALKMDWSSLEKPLCVVGNLPYNISSSLLVQLSVEVENIEHLVFMFQKEVAERVESEKNKKSYGWLSILSQLFWDIERVAEADPNSFYPAPKVASRVLKFKKKDTVVEDRKDLLKFLKASFSQRRKFLVKNLLSSWKPSGAFLEVFQKLGIEEKSRAEDLTPEQFLELYSLSKEW